MKNIVCRYFHNSLLKKREARPQQFPKSRLSNLKCRKRYKMSKNTKKEEKKEIFYTDDNRVVIIKKV
jgi:hypothetical protein